MLEHAQAVKSLSGQQPVRPDLDMIIRDLPRYGSSEFWRFVEQQETPLEILTRLFRAGHPNYPTTGLVWNDRQRLLTTILLRIRFRNQRWASATVLKYCDHRRLEHTMLAEDLLADLEEELCRSISNSVRSFWEINFMASLSYIRRRVRRAFMLREGHWCNANAKRTSRIPRDLIMSIDQQSSVRLERGAGPMDIEDEYARAILSSVDISDLHEDVLGLPLRMRAIIENIFWHGLTEKDTARVLGISDRTVRNHLRKAYIQLSERLGDSMTP